MMLIIFSPREATAERLASAGYKVYGTSRRGAQTGQRSFEMLPLDVTSDAGLPIRIDHRGYGLRRKGTPKGKVVVKER